MPKITRYGGMSNAGLTEKDGGLVDNTAKTVKHADAIVNDNQENDVVVDSPEAAPTAEAPFNPQSMSVADVNALQDECTPEEWEAVLEAERAGKNRAGIVNK